MHHLAPRFRAEQQHHHEPQQRGERGDQHGIAKPSGSLAAQERPAKTRPRSPPGGTESGGGRPHVGREAFVQIDGVLALNRPDEEALAGGADGE